MNSSGDGNVEQDNEGKESVRFCLNILKFGFTGGIKITQSRLGKKYLLPSSGAGLVLLLSVGKQKIP